MKILSMRRLVSAFFFGLSIVCIMAQSVSPALAAPLPPSEVKATNENPNWVADACALASSTPAPSTPSTPASGPPPTSTTMYDSADPTQIPSSAKVVASYVGDSNGYQIAKNKFPNATVISINETRGSSEAADIWGIESGSGRNVQSTAEAIANGKVHGVYGSQSDLDAVKNILNSKNVPRSSSVLWLWGSGTHGDSSIPAGDDAHQYKFVAGKYDVSSISATFVNTILGMSTTPPTSLGSSTSGTCCDTTPSVPVTGGTPSTLVGNNNVQKSFNYFIQAGFTPAQSAGIVGNFMQESGGGTTVDPGSSNGIAGFLDSPLSMSDMQKWVTNNDPGQDPSSLKGQLDFVLWYITKSDKSIGDDVKAAKTVEDATIAFQNDFEKCGSTCVQSNRVQYAKDVLNGKYGGSSVSSGGGSLDITDIVKKYNLQSAIIQNLGNGNNIVASYNPDKPPVTPASTMKLIIADTALQSGLNLDKTITVTPNVYYNGANDLNSNKLTLREAMQQMLDESSNVGANVLMKAMGGVGAFTNKAHSYGYNNTDVKGYYDPSNDGKNSSTIGDEAAAMNHIFARNGTDYQTAQDALKQAAQTHNTFGINDIANKWAGTNQVAGNVGLFNINGNQYIIGLYYNGDYTTPPAKNAITNGTSDLVSAVSGQSSSSSDSGTCCAPSTGSDPTTLSGNDNTQKVYNFFVNTMGYTPQQAAGAAGSLYFESGGMNPTISNGGGSGAYGIAQWLGSRYTDLQTYAGSNYNTLEGQVSFMEHELKTDYASVNSQMKQTTSYQDAQKTWTWYYEGLKDYSDQWFFDKRNGFAQDILQKYGGGASAGGSISGSGSTGADCAGGAGTSSSVIDAAVKAAKQLSSYKVPYVWGGLHGSDELKITDPATLQKKGMDCSSSVSWVLHQAGVLGTTADDSTGLESWGQAGKGTEMTVWANSYHVFLELNVPGVGHYQLNTVNSGGAGAGPRWEPWSYSNRDAGAEAASSGGYTPRHWSNANPATPFYNGT